MPYLSSPRMRKFTCILWAVLAWSSAVPPSVLPSPPRVFQARVRYVIDGDTVVLASGIKVRYQDVNAPEIAHKDRPAEPFGYDATAFNRSLVQGRVVEVEPAGNGRDRYGRLTGYVFVDGRMVNELLLSRGLAHVCLYNGKDRYSDRLLKAQRRAMAAGMGIWSIGPRFFGFSCLGNRASFKFHRMDCPFGRMTRRGNRVVFDSAWQAFYEGYCPCKKCSP